MLHAFTANYDEALQKIGKINNLLSVFTICIMSFHGFGKSGVRYA